MEIWKEYCEGIYVSNMGRVIHDYSYGNSFRPHLCNIYRYNNGYCMIKAKGKMLYIHRLVGLLFIPNIENKPTIDHINRNKGDNKAENLRWATRREQQLNKKKMSQKTKDKIGKGNKKAWIKRRK